MPTHLTWTVQRKVVDNFVSNIDDKTPQPLRAVQRFIEFDVLLKYTVALKADRATDTMPASARDATPCSKPRIFQRPVYFLYTLRQNELSRLAFPLGSYAKTEVRTLAEKFQLATACKEDSQDVCFLEGRDYRTFLNERADPSQIKSGPIRTLDGKVLGEHKGLPFYTIGQREKLGIAVGEKLYVIAKNPEDNALIVGADNETIKDECRVKDVSWCFGPPAGPVRASVKIRYRHPGAESTVTRTDETNAHVQFDNGQTAVTPGQSAVFYRGDEVLGGGIIERTA